MPRYWNIAAYKFVPLPELGRLRGRLLDFCKARSLRGTLLLSPEGLNLFIAGERTGLEELLVELRALPGCHDLEVKWSESSHQPFRRMLVRLKKEIIAFGVPGVAPASHTSPKLPAETLKQWLDEGRPVTLLDTRNDYEIKLGTFKEALPIGVDHFRDFPAAVRRLPAALKDQPIVMFCTGGIRCEKAGPFMEMEGFKHVFQLEGGILRYFERCGGAHYEGECFVFDQRVGVDPGLHETESTQCFACLTPLTAEETRDPRYVPAKSCPHCYLTPEQAAARRIEERHAAIHAATHPLPGSVPYDNYRPISVPAGCDGGLLVDALERVVRHIPATEWQRECDRGLVVDKERRPAEGQRRVRAGERYWHRFPDQVEPAVNPAIRVLHEDEALIVIDKPAPLPMHAGGRFNRNTLQYILNQVYHPEKPRPAHRLDANTTGLVLFTRSRFFASKLQPQFAGGLVDKRYLVLTRGAPHAEIFSCDAAISDRAGEVGTREIDEENGLASRTEFRVIRRQGDGTCLLEARPLTGRTNQIRVHLWHLGFPVVGDPVYLEGGALGTVQTVTLDDPPLCLHSWKISFNHPLDGRRLELQSATPAWAGNPAPA